MHRKVNDAEKPGADLARNCSRQSEGQMCKGSREACGKKNKNSLEFHSQDCSQPSWEANPLNNTDKMLPNFSVDTLLLITHSKVRHLLEMPKQPCITIKAEGDTLQKRSYHQ